MSNNAFGPWLYRGYTIKRMVEEYGPIEFVIFNSENLEMASFGNLSDAQEYITATIEDTFEYSVSNW